MHWTSSIHCIKFAAGHIKTPIHQSGSCNLRGNSCSSSSSMNKIISRGTTRAKPRLYNCGCQINTSVVLRSCVRYSLGSRVLCTLCSGEQGPVYVMLWGARSCVRYALGSKVLCTLCSGEQDPVYVMLWGARSCVRYALESRVNS